MDSTDNHIRTASRLWREGVMALSINTCKMDEVIVVRFGGVISDHRRDPFNELRKALAQNGSKTVRLKGRA